MGSNLGINYRVLYGKLFSGLLSQFGINYVSEIEDAIQNSFLKSLKFGHKIMFRITKKVGFSLSPAMMCSTKLKNEKKTINFP